MSLATLHQRVSAGLEERQETIRDLVMEPGAVKTWEQYMALVCQHAAYKEAGDILRDELIRLAKETGDEFEPR